MNIRIAFVRSTRLTLWVDNLMGLNIIKEEQFDWTR